MNREPPTIGTSTGEAQGEVLGPLYGMQRNGQVPRRRLGAESHCGAAARHNFLAVSKDTPRLAFDQSLFSYIMTTLPPLKPGTCPSMSRIVALARNVSKNSLPRRASGVGRYTTGRGRTPINRPPRFLYSILLPICYFTSIGTISHVN